MKNHFWLIYLKQTRRILGVNLLGLKVICNIESMVVLVTYISHFYSSYKINLHVDLFKDLAV